MFSKKRLRKLYWQDSLSLKEIANRLDVPQSTIYYHFRTKHNIPTHNTVWQKLEIDNQELRETLNTKYSSMKARTEGRTNRSKYEGLELLSEIKFVQLCNGNKDRILEIWNKYLKSNRELKYALSIDRIDRSLGYTKDNIQFVFNGFNSWKDEINPIKIVKNSKTYFFSSPAEASRFFDCRADDIREPLRGSKYNRQDIDISEISINRLLSEHNCDNLYSYYLHHLI